MVKLMRFAPIQGVCMNPTTGNSPDHSRLAVIGYGVGLVACLAIWAGIFAATRHIVKETTSGKTQVARLTNGLPEGRSSTLRSTDCK
jgi:hypothetical protein